jgi:transitional endoplasmic reticulum ATPase
VDPTLKKNDIFLNNYRVSLFIGFYDNVEYYRVCDENENNYLLKICTSLLREVEYAKIIEKDSIEKYITSGKVPINNRDLFYVIYEFVSGETLYNKVKREGPAPSIIAVSILTKILDSLNYLHNLKKPIIHNNVNLESVILDYLDMDEAPYLTDFSKARYVSETISYVEAESLNPFYCAPELYRGVILPECDVYSSGVLLFNLLNKSPFSLIDFRNEEYRENQLDLTLKKLQIDSNLKAVLKKALATDYKKRFKSAEEFKESLLSKDFKLIDKGSKKGKGFADIAGMDDLKELLHNDVIKALNEKELYKSYGLTIPNGILLYGPPGCGKTYIAEKLAEEVNFNIISIKPSDLASTYVHGTQQKIGNLFKEAEDKKPSIIFLDEVDAMVPKREGGEFNRHYDAEVNEFLSQMSNCSEKDIFIIATSNRPEIIDPAILRTGRIDKIIYVPPPDEKARSQMFELYLKNRPIPDDLDYDELSKLTENFVSSDIKFIVDESSRKALKNKEKISQLIIFNVIKNFKPTVNEELIKSMKNFKKEEEKKKRKIGFADQGD